MEAALLDGVPQAGALEALAGAVRATGDALLLGRILCLRSRSEIMQGRHASALSSATDGLHVFESLDPATALVYAGLHAEMYRAAGTALSKLGRVAEALPRLEEAVRIAQAGFRAAPPPRPDDTVISPQAALVRSLITLGVALFAIREIDIAIDVYERAMLVAEAHPDLEQHFLDDVMLARWNLADALHERARRRRIAGDAAAAALDIGSARSLLDAEAWRITATDSVRSLSAFGRAAYFSALGHQFIVEARPTEALTAFATQLAELQRLGYADDWGIADANGGMAQAALDLGQPRDALDHCTISLDALDRHDESNTRATVLQVQAAALHAAGDFAAAYAALERHHALRAGLEAVAAQQYASHMTAQIGLERARADAESHRRIAAMLETLGRIGQEITAKLDARSVFELFARHVGELLPTTAFTVWLLDAAGTRLTLVFGIEDDRKLQAGDIAVDEPHSYAARAVRERREVFVAAPLPERDGVRPLAGTRAMQSALFEPLIVGERVLGVVSVQSDRATGYSENERSMFRTLGTYAAIALDNAAAYTKLEQTVITLQATKSELAKQTAEFERLSMTDMLTGVANRRYLHERGQVEIATLRRHGGELSVAMFDIDHFKRVNDTYGHAVGDVVLQQVARAAKTWLRPGDLIARIGGEEFALLLPGVALREAVVIAERIRASIADIGVISGAALVRVTTSFGVATFAADFDTLDDALHAADSALYAAKQAGRDRVHAVGELPAIGTNQH